MINFVPEEKGVLCVTRDGVEIAKFEVQAGSTTSFVGEYTFEAGATIPEPEVDSEELLEEELNEEL